jgi:phage terminase large subunit
VLAQKARPTEATTPDANPAGRGFTYGLHIAPHDIRVRELGTGQSRWETAAQLGIRFTTAPALPLADGIDAVRRHLPRFWFDAAACAAGVKALRAYRRRWRAGAAQNPHGQTVAGPLHDWASHAADALRYAVTGFRPRQDAAGVQRARTDYDMFGGV